MATKADILTEVGQRLGDTTSTFLTGVVGPLFNRVIDELALKDCIRSLRRTAMFTFEADDYDYDTRTLTGLASPHYPRKILKVQVPAWGWPLGFLEWMDEMTFDSWRATHQTDPSVTGYRADRPRGWRTYPNEQTLQVIPTPSSDYTDDDVELLYIAPPAVLGDDDEITEIRQEHIPAIIAGMTWYGLPFQDETLIDRSSAFAVWQDFIATLKADTSREPGRFRQAKYREW